MTDDSDTLCHLQTDASSLKTLYKTCSMNVDSETLMSSPD